MNIKMDKWIILLFSLIVLIFLPGCESIPPGTAPEGPIVEISQSTNTKPVSIKAAINAMTTSLLTSPVITSADNPPKVLFQASPLNLDQKAEQDNSLLFNNNALAVYKNLLYSDLIKTPSSFNNYDYDLISTFMPNNTIKNSSNDRIMNWTLSLYNKKEKNEPVWTYSLNVFIKDQI